MTSNHYHYWIFLLATAIMLAACSGGNKVANEQFAFLDKLGITVTDKLLLGDSLALPDIYCGDPSQADDDLPGTTLDRSQYEALILPAGSQFASSMSLWQLLGVRDMGNGNTLAAYYIGDNVGYCIYLITYDVQGKVLDAINARELHLVWRVNLSDHNNNDAYSLDGHFTFQDKDRLVLHRLMSRCVMDFDADRKSEPQWQQGWDQTYTVNEKGAFVLHGQQVTSQQGKVDQYAAMDLKSWDLLVCSQHDSGVMDLWNDYAALVSETYDPNYKYNPFPLDVEQLYKMNPQRFLSWMAAKRENGNNLLPYFKFPVDDRPTLIGDIGSLDDPAARQWLTAIVNSWDAKPLTQHL